MELRQQQYFIQDIPVTQLAKEFGTPLYVYNGDTIVRQIEKLKKAYAGVDLKIKYAAKALTNISILKFIRKQGVGVEVVSPEEAKLALKAGFLPSEIMFTPSGVHFSEVEEGVSLGVPINLDNLSTLEKFGAKYGNSIPLWTSPEPEYYGGRESENFYRTQQFKIRNLSSTD